MNLIKSFVIMLICMSFISLEIFAQNHTIDSLILVLKNQPEDSNRIKTLNNLGNTLNTIGDGKSSQIY